MLRKYSWLPDVLRIEGSVRLLNTMHANITHAATDNYPDCGPSVDGNYICSNCWLPVVNRQRCAPHKLGYPGRCGCGAWLFIAYYYTL
jgi:hypothetical protein